MTDRPEASPWLRLIGALFVSATLALSPNVFAQDDTEEDETVDEEESTEEIVVTGSRLKRDTYSSISPLQIITGQLSREVGLIDAGDILQESTAAGGQQIDLTFQGFVLDNGPGASTISLRGLGAGRTLVLVNGRRLAPAGVEGAPSAPDLNLIPASLVQQYDILLDGASSVYGSDAIAGVTNVILRQDFDGFEVDLFSRVPHHSKGVDHTLSVTWGKNFDRGFIGFGAEYVDSERVRLADRPWTEGCEQNAEIDENGNVRTQDVFYSQVFGMEWDECTLGSLAGRISVPRAGSIYYTPGTSNGGWPNFSESSLFGFGVDGDGDGQTDISFRDYDLNGKDSQQNSDLFPTIENVSAMLFGEYTFEGDMNLTAYGEILYAHRDFFSNSSEGQLFPSVPALNPFNPCNPNQPDGVDCGLAYDALMNNPNFVNQVLGAFGCDPSAGGSCDQTGGASGPAAVTPIVSVAGDRNFTDVEGSQYRVVGGVRGDLPMINFGTVENWSFDTHYSITKSDANSFREGIREDRLDLALGVYSTTNTPCEINDPTARGPRSGLLASELQSDVNASSCVPVNLFAPSLYPVGVVTGDFATAAERNYIFDNRDFDTEYEQTVWNIFFAGDVAEMPAGTVAASFGFEVRNDRIDSIPDNVARDGLFFGFFSDGGAVGEKWQNEFFAEVALPLLAGVQGAEELSLEMSARYTDDEFYGGNWTESFKLGWRPVDYLLLRATTGTSFRAPNLRELFLLNQSGFNGIFDPCYIPGDAIDPLSGGYNPALDDRDDTILSNCVAQGVDPTLANNNGFNTFSTEIAAGGALDLLAEESESWSAGFAWDLPNVNAFDLSLSATYYEIEVINTIIEPTGQFIVNDCYGSETGNSAFCSRIDRNLSDPTNPEIDFIRAGFINRDSEKARGVDVNLSFDDQFTIAERPIDFGLDITANRLLERSTLFTNEDGSQDFNAFQGEFGFPTWRGQMGMRFDYDDFRFTYELRYLGSVEQDINGIDAFDDAITGGSDTCEGPPNDVLCRDIGFADNYFLHNASFYYFGDRWTIGGGIRNLLDEEPPFVDGTEVLSVNNAPIGVGYDLNGRTYFLNVTTSFGGGE